jgi:hypothetical protein
MGRPSSFTQQTADAICERLALGESLRSICRDPAMPSNSAVAEWLGKHSTFAEQYARAKTVGLDLMAEEIIAISDRPSGCLDNGATDAGDVAHRRLQIDTRKWYLSKLAPKRYGEKAALELTGADGGAIQVDDSSAATKLAKILAAAQARKGATSHDPDPVDTSDLI